MINENEHIIKFKYSSILLKRLGIDDNFFIKLYSSSKNINNTITNYIYYNNLNIYTSKYSNNRFDYIFNLSNMLYKLHNPYYYSKTYWNKELI